MDERFRETLTAPPRRAPETSLCRLCEEIVKTEKYERRQGLHEEADILGRNVECLRG